MLTRLVSCFAVLGVASLAFAQTQPRLIGIAQNPAALATVSMHQDMTNNCATQLCPLPMPVPAQPFAGGTAYDATRGAVWHTNGALIGLFDPNTCAPVCPPMPLPPGVVGVATGLALNESTGVLWLSDSLNNLYQLKPSCPIAPIAQCLIPSGTLPAGSIIGGLACSNIQKWLFYSASAFVGAPNNTVYVASQGSPCVPFCKFPLTGCGGLALGAITGLAWDDCRDVLWATDGFLEQGVFVQITAAGCQTTQVGCCRVANPERYRGLCIEPSHAVPMGASCTTPPCAACATMSHDSLGDATLGNPSFTLQLNNAPSNATAILALNVGACSAPGVPIPPFCANLLVPLPGMVTIGYPTGGTGGCTGSVSQPLGIPGNPIFCGLTLSSQFFVVCLTAVGVGTGVSNCLSWMISAS